LPPKALSCVICANLQFLLLFLPLPGKSPASPVESPSTRIVCPVI
jgi:hypothetical protein